LVHAFIYRLRLLRFLFIVRASTAAKLRGANNTDGCGPM